MAEKEDVQEKEDVNSYPAVLVIRIPGEDGVEQIQIREFNGLDPLSVPTLLKAAAKIKEQNLIG